GDANFLGSSGTTTVATVASVYVLNPSACGALTASGNASLTVPGVLYVDSNSGTASVAHGNASVSATQIEVVVGYQASGNATFHPAPRTHAGFVADPLARLAAPTGGAFLGAVNLSGNATRTISPGVYSQIKVSGNARLTMLPGVYVIAGGGFAVSGGAG